MLYILMPRRDMRLKYRRCATRMRIDTGSQESVCTRVSPGEDGIVQTGSKFIHIVKLFPPASLNLFDSTQNSEKVGAMWTQAGLT